MNSFAAFIVELCPVTSENFNSDLLYLFRTDCSTVLRFLVFDFDPEIAPIAPYLCLPQYPDSSLKIKWVSLFMRFLFLIPFELPGEQVRLDCIITINGKPGPAFDEYDSYANACLSCQGGNED